MAQFQTQSLSPGLTAEDRTTEIVLRPSVERWPRAERPLIDGLTRRCAWQKCVRRDPARRPNLLILNTCKCVL